MHKKIILTIAAAAALLATVMFVADADLSSITLDANGGSIDTTTAYYDTDDGIVYLSDIIYLEPTRDGYTFTGWYDSDGTLVTYIDTTGTVPSVLYAGWEENTYTISYDFGIAGSSGLAISNSNAASYTYGDTITFSDASCAGYEFEGWYSDAELTTELEGITSDMLGDITVYAAWTENTYSITYVLTQDGIDLTEEEITSSNTTSRTVSEKVYFSVAVSLKDGISFDGWYTDDTYTTQIEYISAYTTSDVTVYAHWTRNSYTIKYDYGVLDLDTYTVTNSNPSIYTYGEPITLSDPVTDDPAYTFAGWYTDSDYTTQITTVEADDTGDLTLYALWEANIYTITYVLTDPVLDIDVSLVTNNNPTETDAVGEIVLEDAVFLNEYYSFEGWYLDKARTIPVSVLEDRFCENLTLYALWGDAVYDITYDYGILSDYEELIENTNITTYVPDTTYTLTDLSVDGFVFIGWYEDSSYTQVATGITSDMTGDRTFYAYFSEKTYSITYVLVTNDSLTELEIYNTDNPSIRTTLEEVTLADPTVVSAYYVFVGWYADEELTEQIEVIEAGTAENVTVYACWSAIVTYIPSWGDASLSGGTTTSDARLILLYSLGLDTFTDEQLMISDVNNDGSVNMSDARIVLRLSLSLEDEDDIIETYSLGEISIVNTKLVIS